MEASQVWSLVRICHNTFNAFYFPPKKIQKWGQVFEGEWSELKRIASCSQLFAVGQRMWCEGITFESFRSRQFQAYYIIRKGFPSYSWCVFERSTFVCLSKASSDHQQRRIYIHKTHSSDITSCYGHGEVVSQLWWWAHLQMILDSHLDTFGSNFSNIYIYIYITENWETYTVLCFDSATCCDPARGVRGPWGGLRSGAFASCFVTSWLSLFEPCGTSCNHLSEARSVEWSELSMTLPWLSSHW